MSAMSERWLFERSVMARNAGMYGWMVYSVSAVQGLG